MATYSSARACATYMRKLSLSKVFCNTPRFRPLILYSSTATDTNTDENATSEDVSKVNETTAEHESLNKEIETIKLQAQDAMDKYKRALAETENVRQRMKNQIDDAKLFGIQGFCKDLLEVADTLAKATESVPVDELTASNPHLKNLYEGLLMTDKQLLKVFTRHGLEAIKPEDGDKFDPFVHEALFQVPIPGKEPGTVAEVTKIGYKLHNRTIRPALVGVVRK